MLYRTFYSFVYTTLHFDRNVNDKVGVGVYIVLMFSYGISFLAKYFASKEREK